MISLRPDRHPGYVGNPNNANGRIEADVPLLGEMGEPLGAEVDEPIVDPVIDEVAEPIAKGEELVIAPVIDVEEDIAMLFGDDDFSDDDYEGFEDDEEVWEVNEEWLMAPVTPPPMPVVPPPSTYEVGGPSTAAAGGQSFTLQQLDFLHGQLVKKVIQVSDAEVVDGIAIREIGPRVSAVEGHVQVMASQMVHAVGRLEQAAVQHRDVQIQQLQALVSEMSSRESTLMQCIIGMDRCLADLERRPPGPQ
ncbi:hypothetical protein Tco_0228571 [Tanacetum coccineum]